MRRPDERGIIAPSLAHTEIKNINMTYVWFAMLLCDSERAGFLAVNVGVMGTRRRFQGRKMGCSLENAVRPALCLENGQAANKIARLTAIGGRRKQ